jgi:hypothetical protein
MPGMLPNDPRIAMKNQLNAQGQHSSQGLDGQNVLMSLQQLFNLHSLGR